MAAATGGETGVVPVLGSPVFVGRERELVAAEQVLATPPALVLIEGEAGIGKTRLVNELLNGSKAGLGRVLVAACPPFRQPHTLGPLVDAIRQAAVSVAALQLSGLAGALRPLFPEWSADLPPSPEPAEDATAARHRLFGALTELLGAMETAVLVVEDAHWADDATAEFVMFLVAQRPPRVSVVLTWRPEDLGADSLLHALAASQLPGLARLRLTLGPLTVEQTDRLVSSMLHGESLSPAFAHFLHEGTDGVPLALEESVRLMYDQADLICRPGGWARRRMDAIVIAPTVREAVAERARRLHPHAQMILRAAAVLAEPADTAVVLAVSGLSADAAGAGLDEALRSGLVAEYGRGLIGFRHGLAGRAVYDLMPAGERRQVHRRAGQALEEMPAPVAARLARHFREAGDQLGWFRYGEQAADQALAAGDERLATATLYELATTPGQGPAMLLRIIRKLPSLPAVGHEHLQNLAHTLRTVLDRGAEPPAEAAQLRVQLGRILTSMHQYEAGHAELATAVTDRGLDAMDRARAMILLGWPFGPSQPAIAHRRWLRRAGEVLATIEPSRQQGLGLDRATALLMLGEEEGWPAAAALDDPSSGLLPSLRVVRDLNVGDGAMMWGRFGEARRRLTRALRAAEQHQYPTMRGLVLVCLARLDWLCGAWSGLAERAGELAGLDDLPSEARAEATLVLAQLRAATTGGARGDLAAVLAAARQCGALPLVANSAAALARVLLDEGDAADAVAVTDEPAAMLASMGVWVWATDLAPARAAAQLAAGRYDDAAALAVSFAQGLQGRDAPGPRAALLACRALLAEFRAKSVRSAAMLETAAAGWAAIPRPYDALLFTERRARCLVAAGQREQGVAVLSQVAQEQLRLGARCDADRTFRVLREHSAEARSNGRRGRPSYGAQLSPREWEVVDLVAQGRTNRQIAQLLVLSVPTIGGHVRSAMRKLEVSSRTALAVRAMALRGGSPAGHPKVQP